MINDQLLDCFATMTCATNWTSCYWKFEKQSRLHESKVLYIIWRKTPTTLNSTTITLNPGIHLNPEAMPGRLVQDPMYDKSCQDWNEEAISRGCRERAYKETAGEHFGAEMG